VVAAGVEGDADAVPGRDANGRRDVVGRLGTDDGHGALVDGKVPRLPGHGPALGIRQDDVAREVLAELAKLTQIGQIAKGHGRTSGHR
jgi:hypothetical protein